VYNRRIGAVASSSDGGSGNSDAAWCQQACRRIHESRVEEMSDRRRFSVLQHGKQIRRDWMGNESNVNIGLSPATNSYHRTRPTIHSATGSMKRPLPNGGHGGLMGVPDRSGET
jgi:hypothetical protein